MVHLCVLQIDTADKVKVTANSASAPIYFTPGRFLFLILFFLCIIFKVDYGCVDQESLVGK